MSTRLASKFSIVASAVLVLLINETMVPFLFSGEDTIFAAERRMIDTKHTGSHDFIYTIREAPMWKTEIPGWLAHTENIKPPRTPGAFLHLGKTGGSTLSHVLRNGCHSWVPKPCHIPTNESYVSQLSTYYHLPDFQKLN